MPVATRVRSTSNVTLTVPSVSIVTPPVITAPLQQGLRTPRSSFVFPILQSLSALGGTATINEVMTGVKERMNNILNSYDYATLSNRNEARWRNTARWCRDGLVNLGLIADDSPRGTWTITEFGVEFLSALR